MMCQTPAFTGRKPEEWQKQNKKIAISEEEGYNKKV